MPRHFNRYQEAHDLALTPDNISAWMIFPITISPAVHTPELKWVAAPLSISNTHLVFSGQTERNEQALRLRISYGSELLSEISPSPGFVVAVPLRNGIYRLELWEGEKCLNVWEAIPATQEAYAKTGMVQQAQSSPATVTPNMPYAFHGRMGQLFLGGDSNDSIGQFVEDRQQSSGSINDWSATFNQFNRWKNAFNLDNLSLLIAPAKEEVLREYYPFPRAKRTVVDDFRERFRDQDIIFPIWELWERRHLSYSTTDTHWTDFGATAVAMKVLRNWAISDADLPQTFTIKQRIGDLGSKVHPHASSFDTCFLPEVKTCKVFDNGINNQGCIRVFHNAHAPRNESLVIFGDSFGTNLAEAFTAIFQRVIYTYQPAGLDPELVRLVKPKHILLQITQRFLHGSPATGHSVFKMAQSKMQQMPHDEQTRLRAHLSTLDEEFAPLVTPLL